MTKITGRRVLPEEAQTSVTVEIAGSTRAVFDSANRAVFSASIVDSNGNQVNALAGATATAITSASAATAGSTSALSSFTIAHGLGAVPTKFAIQPGDAQAAAAQQLGFYVTADATNVYFNTVSAVTASKPYTFQWFASR